MPTTTTDSANPASRFAPLTEAGIQAQTDSGSFSRGKSYFRRGMIHDTVLRGDTLEALCDGSDYQPYQVRATLALCGQRGNNPREAACSCPRGGFCKHIVALLLSWIANPARFTERPTVSDAIAGKSHEDLAALVGEMIRRQPDLEVLLDIPMTAGQDGSANVATIDEATIRRQVRAATMRLDGWEWGSARVAAQGLDAIIGLGRRYSEAEQWANARVVFATVADETMGMFEGFDDSDGDLTGVITDCDTGLARCLEAQADIPEPEQLSPQQRERLIRDLYDIWRFDSLEIGGIGMSDAGWDAIVSSTTDDERAMVEGWLRKEEGSEWTSRSIIAFRVALREQAGASDDDLLEIYREAEQWDDVAQQLLELDRVGEAISVARRHIAKPFSLTRFADALVARGGEDVERAITLVDDRLWEKEGENVHADARLQDWLRIQYSKHGRAGLALEMAQRGFRRQPSLQSYLTVRDAARLRGQPEGTWDELRTGMLDTFREMNAWTVLVDIYLDEGNVGAALDAHRKHSDKDGQGHTYRSGYGGRGLQLAKAAEQDFPDEAIAIYRALADGRIGMRNRGSYQEAADHLSRVKATLEQHGRADEWPPLIADLRATHKTLRALQDELNKAGL